MCKPHRRGVKDHPEPNTGLPLPPRPRRAPAPPPQRPRSNARVPWPHAPRAAARCTGACVGGIVLWLCAYCAPSRPDVRPAAPHRRSVAFSLSERRRVALIGVQSKVREKWRAVEKVITTTDPRFPPSLCREAATAVMQHGCTLRSVATNLDNASSRSSSTQKVIEPENHAQTLEASPSRALEASPSRALAVGPTGPPGPRGRSYTHLPAKATSPMAWRLHPLGILD